MSDFEECEAVESWNLRQLRKIDENFCSPAEMEKIDYFHKEEILSARSRLLDYGLRGSVPLTESDYDTIFSDWVLVHESWAEVENTARTKAFCANLKLADPHPNEAEVKRQISVDVDRSYGFFDIHQSLSVDQTKKERKQLSDILLDVLHYERTTEPADTSASNEVIPLEVRYLQGLHDVCCVVREVAKQSHNPRNSHKLQVKLSRLIVAYRIFPQHSSMSLLLSTYQTLSQVTQILHRFRPDVLSALISFKHEPINVSSWTGDGSELHGILPWMITLFAHAIPSFSAIVAVWNILFALPPPLLSYWLAATLLTRASDHALLGENPFLCDANAIHEFPSLFSLLVTTTDLITQYTPLQLAERSDADLSVEEDFNSKWFDAAESFVTSPKPHSVLPPFWFPRLGASRLAPRLDKMGLIRGLDTGALKLYQSRLNRLEIEWKMFREHSQWTTRKRSSQRHLLNVTARFLHHMTSDFFFVLAKPVDLLKIFVTAKRLEARREICKES